MQAVVLAGGSSSRFWPLNTRHKCLFRICGKSLLRHTLESLHDAGITEAVIVQGAEKDIEDELDVPSGMTITFTVQEESKGMGDALDQAREHVTGQFLVTGPYRIDAGLLLETMSGVDEDNDGAVIGTETGSPGAYGMLKIEDGNAVGVVEKPSPSEAPSEYRIISTYLLDDSIFDYLDEVEDHEYSFEDALDTYMDEQTVGFTEVTGTSPSLKYPWDVLAFAELLLDRQEPSVSDSAEIAESATVEGNVVIEDGVTVYENAVIRGPCYIGEDCVIGNNALVRANTSLDTDCRIGANMEMRGVVAEENLSTHSGFIGDSVFGRNVAVGAGTVTANRLVRDGNQRPNVAVHVDAKDETVDTGRDRLGALVGDEVDIGTQANLMPGVCIGARSFVGPSAMVRHNVGEDRRYFTKVEGTELER